jgi:hypothetical protein|tara:strand:+ start:296 stop:508 length:213 start_codon:yes stop_codon:yes gene_type:complete
MKKILMEKEMDITQLKSLVLLPRVKIRRNRSVIHCPDIADIRFEGLFKAKRALSLFRLSDGTSSQNSGTL